MHDHVDTVDDALLTEVRSVFDDAEFVELGFTIAQFISMGQFVKLLGVPNPDTVPDGEGTVPDGEGTVPDGEGTVPGGEGSGDAR